MHVVLCLKTPGPKGAFWTFLFGHIFNWSFAATKDLQQCFQTLFVSTFHWGRIKHWSILTKAVTYSIMINYAFVFALVSIFFFAFVGGIWDILSFIELEKTFSIEVRCSTFPLKNSGQLASKFFCINASYITWVHGQLAIKWCSLIIPGPFPCLLKNSG